MKKFLLSVVFSFFVMLNLFQHLFAQTNIYHPFPDSNAVWRWGCNGLGFNCCCSCGGTCIEQTNTQDSIIGDTIIGIYTYKKIWEASVTEDYFTGPTNCAPWGYPAYVFSSSPYFYKGAMRQDISQKKIYLNISSSTKDTLFYDFNLNVGDTLTASAIANSQNYFVSKVDSVLIKGNYRKRFWLWNKTNNPPAPSDSGNVAYIEGIGNTFGLFSGLFEPFEYGCGLNCVQVNSTTIYPDSTYHYCSPLDVTLSTKENKNNFSFSISPNPSSGIFTVNSSTEIKDVVIYNVYGEKIYSSPNICHLKTFQIDLSSRSKGIYFYKLTTEEDKISSGKLIIE